MTALVKTALFVALSVPGVQAGERNAHALTDAVARWTPVEISTNRYESSAVFSSSGQAMYFMRADRKFAGYRLFQSRCLDGQWSEPAEVPFAAVAGAEDADPFVTRDGSRLYFISTRHRYPEVGNDDFDIFFVERAPDGQWGRPVRLPEPVNSEGSELLPRLDSKGSLYFGSDRPGGEGGADIYVAVPQTDGAWTVRNVEDLNTAANEYEAAVSDDGNDMAVISDREGKSRLHLFKAEGGRWVHQRRIRAREAVFQVGPLWSPDGRRLMFSQDAGEDSGEIFVVDIRPDPDPRWPPACGHTPR